MALNRQSQPPTAQNRRNRLRRRQQRPRPNSFVEKYDIDLNKDSKRKKADIKELEEIKKKLNTIKIENKIETIKIDKKTDPENQVLKLNRRIP